MIGQRPRHGVGGDSWRHQERPLACARGERVTGAVTENAAPIAPRQKPLELAAGKSGSSQLRGALFA